VGGQKGRHADWAVEARRLDDVLRFLNAYHTALTRRKAELDEMVDYSLKHFNSDNMEQYNSLLINVDDQQFAAKKLLDAQKALLKPYFARVDFVADDEGKPQNFYIGKMTLIKDEDNTLIITDWRAPVATLYYEGRIGRAAYDCPDGNITGEITLKRQYVIENAKLQSITDIDITTNDEFLQAALSSSKDRRLKDIVTTIQAEQNKVIRADMFAPLIVQGAAGGGKTTIALHRVAYMLYAYEKTVKSKNILIMAPNRFFLSYISDVLPDLGVELVAQATFEEFALNYIGRRLRVNASLNLIAYAINTGPHDNPMLQAARLKASLAYRDAISRYCKYVITKSMPKDDFALERFVVIDNAEIRRLLTVEFAYLPLCKRLNELKKSLTNSLKRFRPHILELIDKSYDDRKNEIKLLMPDSDERRAKIIALLNDRDALIKSISNKSKTLVKNYLKNIKIDSPFTYYLKLFGNKALFTRMARCFDAGEAEIIWEQTRKTLESRSLEEEDLPALMLLTYEISGSEFDTKAIRHIVIDEAQDYSLFQFDILKRITNSQSVSILGDLSQGIFDYKGIRDWCDLTSLYDQKTQFMTLEQSYRTTVEIMDKANSVIKRLPNRKAPFAVPVIRHGEPVREIVLPSAASIAGEVDREVTRLKQKGRQSIAVICKTLDNCRELQKLLKARLFLIDGTNADYPGGLLILPSYLAKGLEFDAVLIADASRDNYTMDELDIKLLYIAMTRALHELIIFAAGEMTELI
jgi:DNA helicase-2/ATP-dependent DNA helicase PcrA